jgi:chaperone modulatory protein CbpM
MMDEAEFLAQTGLDPHLLERWIAFGWLGPLPSASDRRDFADADVARAMLIRELTETIAINDEGISVALSLVDQLYGVRSQMRRLVAAIGAQPPAIRQQILAALRGPDTEG